MRLCIPTVDDRGLEAVVSPHFGSAPFFTVADREGVLAVLPNPGCHARPHACHHAALLTAEGVDTVACGGIGRNAVRGLREAGFEVLGPATGTVAEVLARARAHTLHPLDLAAACDGHHHHEAVRPKRRHHRHRSRGAR